LFGAASRVSTRKFLPNDTNIGPYKGEKYVFGICVRIKEKYLILKKQILEIKIQNYEYK
jgi:hypothetical protein